MAASKPGLILPVQLLAAWLGVWLGRALQEQVDCLKAESRAKVAGDEERDHQGLDDELIVLAEAANGVGEGDRRERLGGRPGCYHREAA